MHSDDPMQSGRWCEEHRRHECTRQRNHGRGSCHNRPIAGLDTCRMHGGQSGEVLRAKGSAMTAWSALSGEPTVSSTDAVLGMLQVSWLRAHMLGDLLRQQVENARSQSTGGGEDGAEWRSDPSLGQGVGFIGHTHGASPNIGVYVTGEAVRGLAQLEAAERDRVVKYAKTAHDMGIADAQVRILDEYASQVTGLINRILDGLELTPAQRQLVSTVVPRELMRLAG